METGRNAVWCSLNVSVLRCQRLHRCICKNLPSPGNKIHYKKGEKNTTQTCILKSRSKSKGYGDLLTEELRDASRALVNTYKLFIATLWSLFRENHTQESLSLRDLLAEFSMRYFESLFTHLVQCFASGQSSRISDDILRNLSKGRCFHAEALCFCTQGE